MEKVMTDQELYTSLICILIFILFILSGFVIWYLLSKNEFKNDEIDLAEEEQEIQKLSKELEIWKETHKRTLTKMLFLEAKIMEDFGINQMFEYNEEFKLKSKLEDNNKNKN